MPRFDPVVLRKELSSRLRKDIKNLSFPAVFETEEQKIEDLIEKVLEFYAIQTLYEVENRLDEEVW